MKKPINPDVILGWARCAVEEGMTVMPLYVKQAAHPDCKDPEDNWNSALYLMEKRKAATTSVDEQDYESRAMYYCMNIAWGDIS